MCVIHVSHQSKISTRTGKLGMPQFNGWMVPHEITHLISNMVACKLQRIHYQVKMISLSRDSNKVHLGCCPSCWPLRQLAVLQTGCKITWHCQWNTVTVKGEVRNFFQGKAPGGFKGRLLVAPGRAHQPFFNFQGGGVNPDFWSLQWSKWKNFVARRHDPLTSAWLRLSHWQYCTVAIVHFQPGYWL